MQPEDRLDALLTLHLERERQWMGQPPEQPHDATPDGAEDEELQPLLAAAYALTAVGRAEPAPQFAARLEGQFLAEAATLRDLASAVPAPPPMSDWADSTPLPFDDQPRLGNDYPTLPGSIWSSLPDEPTEMDTANTGNTGGAVPLWRARSAARGGYHPGYHPGWRRLLWPAIAAALLLAIGMTTLTAAASAGPGSPLYGLRRWEQNLQVTLAGSAADRTKLHIGYARAALTALEAAADQNDVGAPYDDALTTFLDETRAAVTSLDEVPAGSVRDALLLQLEQVMAQGRAGLHRALAVLPWTKRVVTTTALADIGDDVLHVTQAVMVYSDHGQHLWQVNITGSGFQKGAMLLVNGQPAGTVVSVTPTTLVAQLPGDDSASLPRSIGVANPDNTAAQTSAINSHEHADDATPSPNITPTVDDHGGDDHGGNSGPGGGSHDSTPTPTSGTLSGNGG